MLLTSAASGAAPKFYSDDLFSTFLYTGTGATRTISNGINLAGPGGLLWIKRRDSTENHFLFDTVRGTTAELNSNTTDASATLANSVTAFNADGFSLGGATGVNTNAAIYTSWAFRKAPQFFDVQTISHTNGANTNLDIPHLGSLGLVIAKITSTAGDWTVWHSGLTATNNVQLNSTAAQSTTNAWLSVAGTTVTISSSAPTGTYAIYSWAHDTATDGLVQCGTFTTDVSGNASVSLGWEPQWVLLKSISTTGNWVAVDNLRGIPVGGTDAQLYPNLSNAEALSATIDPTGAGFNATTLAASQTYMYAAIRRSNKRPFSGTQIFMPVVYTGDNLDNRLVDTTIAPDMVWARMRTDAVLTGMVICDRLRGQPYLLSGGGVAELNDIDSLDQQLVTAVEYGTAFSSMNGFWVGNDSVAKLNGSSPGLIYIAEAFKRAAGFFDIVCYSGNGGTQTIFHNLGAIPELLIMKCRTNGVGYYVSYPNDATSFKRFQGIATGGSLSITYNSTDGYLTDAPTSLSFTIKVVAGDPNAHNASGQTYVAYLFASIPGVSKIGFYTGDGGAVNTNGGSKTINAGFATGARFVLIKPISITGSWYVFDTARGIVSLPDPYLTLNTAAAEVGNVDNIDPDASGFVVNQLIGTNLNVTGATYIYLAIA